LTREGEIAIAKRIEEGLRELMAAMAYYPGTVEHVLSEYELVEKEEKRLGDVITGYLDNSENEALPADDAAPSAEAEIASPAAAASDSEESEEDDDTPSASDDDDASSGPDPEEARLRFAELAKAHKAAEKAIKKY